jgi:hypothetical protein
LLICWRKAHKLNSIRSQIKGNIHIINILYWCVFSLILTAKHRIPTLQAGMCNLEIPLLYKNKGVIGLLICHPLLKTKGMALMLIIKKRGAKLCSLLSAQVQFQFFSCT